MRSGSSNRSAAWALAGCGLAAVLALALSACGGGSGEATAGGMSAGTVPAQTVQPSRAKGDKRAAGAGACGKQVGGFLGAMDTLRTNLVAGLSYEQYVAEVELIRGAYNRVPVDKLALACLQGAGTPGEAGLNQYIAASNAWTGCVETPGCESASVEPALQSRWRQASKLLGSAEAGLKQLEKHPSAG